MAVIDNEGTATVTLGPVVSNGGRGRFCILVKSGLDYATTFDLLADKKHIVGVHSLQMSIGAIALAFRAEADKKNQIVMPEGLDMYCLPSSGARTKGIDIQSTWEAMQSGTCKTNITQLRETAGENDPDIPTWEELQDWLSNDLYSSFDARTANSRRALQMENADRYQRCLLKTMMSESRNFVNMLNECSAIIRKLTEVGHRVYPSGFRPHVQDTL